MFSHLQIYEPRERALVGAADLALAPLGWLAGRGARRRPDVRRVLLLRLERIGDLLMTLEAVDDARRLWPAAEIDLAVGSWNRPLAALIPGLHEVLIADVPWLAREGAGDGAAALVRKARAWRRRRYDVVVNLEPDIRSNALAWLAGGRARVGYWTGGGRAFLTDAEAYDPGAHVATNARRLVARAAGAAAPDEEGPRQGGARLAPGPAAIEDARRLLAGAARPLVGIHASGGRESKQWHLDRFAGVARRLAEERRATIVLTGSAGDRPLVDAVRERLDGVRVVDVAGALDLEALAALLAELDVLVTGDTGPMHLAAAMGTPVVALFGPSDPARYGPRAARERILRIDLPCSPCGQVRLPPERCRGHVPDCLDGIAIADVVSAAAALLDDTAPRAGATE